MVGRAVEQLYPDRPSGAGDVAARRPRRAHGCPAVRGVSLQVRAGEVVGLGGLVGSGRTELLRLIYGLDTPDAGEVRIDGKRLAPGRARPRDRRRPRPRARGPQVAGPAARVEPDEERQPRRPRPLPARAAERPRRARRGARAAAPRSRPCPTTASASCGELSGGNQQKVVLARWLLHRLPRAAARRADARRRRRDEGRALPRDHRPGRARASACSSSRPSSASWWASAAASS